MKIAIIGPGNMGSHLARIMVAKGHDVALGSRTPDKSAALVSELGQTVTSGDVASAAQGAEILILAVPFAAAADALRSAGDLSGKIVVDIINPITPDYMALTIGHTTSAAEEVARLVPDAKVVKAFNTIFWQILPAEVRAGKPPVQVMLAGDDAAAKATVSALVESLDFEAVDAGPLTNARFLEPVGELNIHFGYALGWGTSIAPAWVRLAA